MGSEELSAYGLDRDTVLEEGICITLATIGARSVSSAY